jgi:drug/metabolite transporter (DMT)-like permease
MLRMMMALLALAGAVVYWLLTELITTRLVEKVVRELMPWEEGLIRFGIPAALAILCIWLLWRRPPRDGGKGGDAR